MGGFPFSFFFLLSFYFCSPHFRVTTMVSRQFSWHLTLCSTTLGKFYEENVITNVKDMNNTLNPHHHCEHPVQQWVTLRFSNSSRACKSRRNPTWPTCFVFIIANAIFAISTIQYTYLCTLPSLHASTRSRPLIRRTGHIAPTEAESYGEKLQSWKAIMKADSEDEIIRLQMVTLTWKKCK